MDDDKEKQFPGPTIDHYLLMDEKQKDMETQKAVIRLQKRIQEILYMLDAEKHQSSISESRGKSCNSRPRQTS